MADLTPEEEQQFADLQAKKAQAAWEKGEAERQTKLEAITPVAAALGSVESITTMLAALRAGRSSVDTDTAIRLDRIVLAMSVDAISILYTAQQLSTPAPQPSAMAAAAPTSA